MKMVPAGCPERSVRNYRYSLHNNPEEGSSQLLRDGNMKSRILKGHLTLLNTVCNTVSVFHLKKSLDIALF